MSEFERLRLLAGKSITETAKALGVSNSTVSNWEKKKQRPQPKKLKEIAAVYGCSIEAVVDAYASQN